MLPLDGTMAFSATARSAMPVQSTSVALRTLDGLRLAATLVTPGESAESAVVLVHGGGVTREEGGFFTRLAAGLGEAGLASLRFDLRGHGESEGRQEELTLATILNDIRVALAHAREVTGATRLSLLGASFGGGICGYYAPHQVSCDQLIPPVTPHAFRGLPAQRTCEIVTAGVDESDRARAAVPVQWESAGRCRWR
ncbi:alpha/beta hydrolase [Nonomuraea sp. NPDC050022]|uniref:alpha/beta hydrolase n=1 Tax=Nonomuraea sp. NPDC050022 TaxID=3364358 RepID=UPI0037B32708